MAGEPDLIVGIDVGMSCTGIAFLNKARRSNVVKVFQSWPGRRQENKVPTRLTYDMRYPNRKPLRWGFECDADNDNPMDLQVAEWFKLYLGRPGQNQERVRKLYTDYLECLYMTLYDYFSPQILNGKVWDTAVIEFVFSVPATWNTDVVDVFKNLAKDAGFGQCPRHKITASLTEPQAVAAFTLCEEKIFENEETILIVDAGGGTLDLCILKIDDKEEGRVSTTELNPVVGAEVGSTYIDTGFQKLAEAKLRPISHLLNSDVEGVAWQMRNSQAFQANKHELGKCRYDSDDCFKIKIPDLQKVITNESLGVDRGEMVFLWGELEQLFEDQVQKIKARINEVLDDLALGGRQRTMPPGKPINHVILSGGLGSSRYVQEQLDKYCRAGQHAMLRGTKLLVSTEPQLAVCRGLINHANQHVSMFPRRCARSSFGIPCRVQYGSKSGEKWREVQKVAKKEIRIKTDEFGQKWIPNCMDWFVTRGSRVCDGDRLAYRYHIKFPPGTPPNQRSCRVQVMTCLDNPPPIFKDKGGVRTQAYMEVNLSRVPERSVDKSIFKQMIGRKHHIVIEFTIEAVIGAAEVSFQCLDDTNKRNELSRPVQLELTLDQGDQTGSMSHAQLSRA